VPLVSSVVEQADTITSAISDSSSAQMLVGTTLRASISFIADFIAVIVFFFGARTGSERPQRKKRHQQRDESFRA